MLNTQTTVTPALTAACAAPTDQEWRMAAGDTLGGFTVGHLAKVIGNPSAAFIIGLRHNAIDMGRVDVLLDYPSARPDDAPAGATSCRLQVTDASISSTGPAGPTVAPHKRPGRPKIHEFGTAPKVVPKGYSLQQERLVQDVEALRDAFKGKFVVLVESAPVADGSGRRRIGIFTWHPSFSRWRHGGYYVGNVSHLNGGIGCVSNNYADKKWRIVCDDRRAGLGEPGDFTFPSRDAAARAELEYTTVLKSL
ncbi:hypothetical protein ACOTC5_31425 [Achromobacter xylosoxidans]